MTDDQELDSTWFDSEPYGDQVCRCPCGHRAELMPEETQSPEEAAWCADCLAGRHEGNEKA
jgi:hypothetical protein